MKTKEQTIEFNARISRDLLDVIGLHSQALKIDNSGVVRRVLRHWKRISGGVVSIDFSEETTRHSDSVPTRWLLPESLVHCQNRQLTNAEIIRILEWRLRQVARPKLVELPPETVAEIEKIRRNARLLNISAGV